MKVKYLGTLLVTSVLGLSVLTSCADTTTDPNTNTEGGGVTEVEPDAGATPDADAMPDTETDTTPDAE